MADDAQKTEILAAYATYLQAFMDNDVPRLNSMIQFPIAYIGNGRTTLMDTVPVTPDELMATKQWHDTRDVVPEVIFVASDKAHVIVRQCTRLRADGSIIEFVSAFYALTLTSSGWKFFAFSDITAAAA